VCLRSSFSRAVFVYRPFQALKMMSSGASVFLSLCGYLTFLYLSISCVDTIRLREFSGSLIYENTRLGNCGDKVSICVWP